MSKTAETAAEAEIQHVLAARSEGLILGGEGLSAVPGSIGKLAQLKFLDLSDNKLTAIPDSIGQLTELEILDLSGNQLTAIPDSIGQLKHLMTLVLSGNRLSTLPDSIGQLTELEALGLSDNKLIELPSRLRSLPNLRIVFLQGNASLNMPSEILGPKIGEATVDKPIARASDILGYYFRIRGGARPLNEAKLILVGRGEVGKTCLVNRLVRDEFDQDQHKTQGINITEWKIALGEKEEVRLNVWDFGGQEIMHATHQFFLTERSLYLLVLNGREGGEDADAEYWLKLIESFGHGSPVIVVLNKIKMHPFDLNKRALQEKYPIIRALVKTDCRDGTGIENLRHAIETETDRLDDLRKPFPASWFAIKEYLEGVADDFLTFPQYRGLCATLGEQEEAAQDALSAYLHTLGIALNYKDDTRLRDAHVLRPRWVTNGIYSIINAELLERQKGELRLSDVSQILDEKKYPLPMQRFLLDLMKKFDLCFSYPEDDTCYLIPELLDKQQPLETREFRREECLNFEYHYPVLLDGLLPRFMVRTHVLSAGLPRWRSGVILQFEGNRALVKADAQERIVFVSVSGSMSGRRRLLAIIRSDFEHIHSLMPNLKPREMVPLPNSPRTVIAYEDLIVWEEAKRPDFEMVADGQIVAVDTQELLNGVDLCRPRRRDAITTEEAKAVRLFCSYSHKDEALRDELETHLTLLQRQGLIKTWHDRKIEAGDEWKTKIDEELEGADIILLLVSADFIVSDYCYEIEMKGALERHEKGEAKVIPVILRDVNWKGAPFAKLQALPKDGLPVMKWADKDSAWRNVEEGIEKVVEEMRGRGRRIVKQ
jgi:internalin A